MSRIMIRPATDADDLDAFNADNRLWIGAAISRSITETLRPDVQWSRHVAEFDGEPAGHALLVSAPIRAAGHGVMTLFVRPEHREHGLGRALLETLEADMARFSAPGYGGEILEGDERSRQIIEHWGFSLQRTHHESELDLTTLPENVVSAAVQRVEAQGIGMRLLSDDAADYQRAYAFWAEHWHDSPDGEDGSQEPPPFEMFRAWFTPAWHCLLAEKGDTIVGITTASSRGGTRMNTMYTVVDEASRGHGVATALKAQHAQVMRAEGMTTLHTQNMSVNVPILAANERLGFRRRLSYIDVCRAVPSGTNSPHRSLDVT